LSLWRLDSWVSRTRDGSTDNTAEELLANDVENAGVLVIRKVSSGLQISDQERSDLSVYMALQFLRTPHMRDNVEQSHTSLMDGVTRSLIRKKDVLASLVAAQRRTSIKASNALAREMSEAYRSGEIKVTVKPEFSLLGMFEQCSTYAEFMSLCRWEVITFPDESQLITSDCPVHFRCENHIALADPETVMHFPLTARNIGR